MNYTRAQDLRGKDLAKPYGFTTCKIPFNKFSVETFIDPSILIDT